MSFSNTPTALRRQGQCFYTTVWSLAQGWAMVGAQYIFDKWGMGVLFERERLHNYQPPLRKAN